MKTFPSGIALVRPWVAAAGRGGWASLGVGPMLVCLGVFLGGTPGRAASVEVELEAGRFDRTNSIVSIQLPSAARDLIGLRGPRGLRIPVQVDADGRGWFTVPRLEAGRTLRLKSERGPAGRAGVGARGQVVGERVELEVDGAAVAGYQAAPGPFPRPGIDDAYRRGGYLHPLRTPSGRVITDDFPANHVHHHGVWFAWTKTRFENRTPDFWNMGQRLGRVDTLGTDAVWSGGVHAGFVARHRYIDLTASPAKPVLDETWVVRAFAGTQEHRILDLEVAQRCASEAPLVLPEYHYGGIGFRGRWEWNGTNGTAFLTSDGITDRIQGHATRGRWCYVGGQVDGAQAGVALLCHPANYRAPQPMRIHPSEPFFCYAPQQLGEMRITPGAPYLSRYRLVMFDGAPDRARLDQLWRDYAEPMVARVRE